MTKKRVYELAKEMGLENKELIARLEKIGIAVKSHSSTLEDSDLERIQSELLSPEPREVVEQRIKSTVIRRRAVRLPAEEAKPEEAPTLPEEEPPAAAAPPAEPAKKEVPPEPVPKEVPVRTSIYRDRPAVEVPPKPVILAEAIPRPAKQASPAAKGEAVRPEAPAAEPKAEPTKKPAPEAAKAPAAEKKPLPVRPSEHRESKPSPAEREQKAQIPPEAARPAPVARKE
jgi:translation initiation factor IF-2